MNSITLESQNRREIGAVILEDIPDIPEEIDERIGQYENTRSARIADWLPDGEGMLITTRFGNTYQLYTIAFPGAARKQITYFEEPVTSGIISPSETRNGFVFRKDIGGGEFDQFFWYDLSNGRSKMISDGTSVNGAFSWSNDGEQFAYSSTRRNGKDHDIYMGSMADPEKVDRIIETSKGYWGVSDWNSEDNKLLIAQYISSTHANGYIYDLSTKKMLALNDTLSEVWNYPLAWTADNKKVYVATNQNSEFVNLGLLDLSTREVDIITKDIPFDFEGAALSRDRDVAAFTVNENGFSRLYLMNTTDNTYEAVENLPVGLIYALRFNQNGDQLGFTMDTYDSPGDVYSLEVNSKQLKRWTNSEIGGLSTGNFSEPELIQYPTFDRVDGKPRELSAFLYKPKTSKGPFPVLISIHGGPEGQYRPGFNPLRAFFNQELNIAVIGPNVRGSEGYGKSFLKLDNGFNREDSVKDIGKLIDWVKTQPDLDANRIAVIGGSYGGYMVLSSMVNFNEDIRCGIDIVGISNFVTFLQNTQAYRRDARRVEYGDERDPEMREFLESISPNNHVEKITKPLLVIQGANDPRVPLSESEQIVSSIREQEGEVWYMVGKNEGHGFSKKDNRELMNKAISLFLQEHLLDQ